ncbi:hypothetical protein BAE44_0008165 [Dichanthelium oligosanthes]|uniref:Uncharacterized protein n=1 Tax=Dichanthelium oligosanthes TaxID=888268 RepID=A0A1E5W098_9POAL|nr:hypothetical protein BAE44_0008165 [Dichanthelium oligosanthes]
MRSRRTRSAEIRDAVYEAENIVEAADYRTKRNSLRKGLLGAMSRYAHKPGDLVALHRLGKDILRERRAQITNKDSEHRVDSFDAHGTYGTFVPVEVLTALSKHGHVHEVSLSVWESMSAFPDSTQLPQNLHTLFLNFPGTWKMWHADLFPTLGRLQGLVNLLLMAEYRQHDAEDPDTELISQRCQKAEVPMYEAPHHVQPGWWVPAVAVLESRACPSQETEISGWYNAEAGRVVPCLRPYGDSSRWAA